MINQVLLIGAADAGGTFVKDSLTAGGFEVLCAPDVVMAQHLISAHPVDLIIADVGVAALLRLQQLNLNVRVLTIGGGEPGKPTEDVPVTNSTRSGGTLAWPFSAIELLAAIWDMDLGRRSFRELECVASAGAATGASI